MLKKSILLVSLLACSSLIACNKTKNYKPGDPLTITSIEMCDEYGESTLIQYKGFDILVDSGSELDAGHVNEVLNNKVTDKEIDLLVVTHPHGDHIGGIINGALEGMSVKQIVDYGYTYDTDGNDKINNSSYVQAYVNKRTSYINTGATYHGIKEQMKISKTLDIDKENDLRIRWLENDFYFGEDEVFPNEKCPTDNPNTTSTSFNLEYKYWNLVMCGDADSTNAEFTIMQNHQNLFKDAKKRIMLKGTHHCSSSSMGSNFLNWTRPEVIFTSSAMISEICAPNQVVLGSGEDQLNHPNKSTVRRIKNRTQNFYWNGINGDITFVTDGVNDMTMSGAGRKRNYLKKEGIGTASIEEEKNVTFFNSEFAKYF